jgi:hypothetical protein
MKTQEFASYLERFDASSVTDFSTKSNSVFTIVKQNIKSSFPYFLFVILFFKLNVIQAQVQNKSDLYVGDNSLFYVGSENFIFGSSVTSIKTSRTKLDYGVLAFPSGAWCSGASDNAYVDGYAQALSNTAFILPIGQAGIYAPAQVTPSTTGGVDAAYFRSDPNSIGGALDNSITAISSVEYWDITSKRVDSSISLSWRPSSAIANLTAASLANLTIVGWNGSNWVKIPSIVDENSILGEISTLNSGSISTNAALNLSNYSAFSLGTKAKKIVVPEFSKAEIIVYINNNTLFIEATRPLKTLIVHDVTGKLILMHNLNGGQKYNYPFNHVIGMYVVTTELSNVNSIIRKKIFNTND